jgi:uncharacterized protein YndB with AHSA1/START domain
VGPISVKTAIDAPRERVYEFLCDLANRPAFTDHFAEEFRLERIQPAGIGAAARFRVADSGFWMETVIDELSPPHRIFERGRGGRLDRIPIFTVWELTEGPSPEGCEVAVHFWTEPSHPLDRLRDALGAERRYRRRWAKALSRLKDLIESGRAVERVEVAGGERLPI